MVLDPKKTFPPRPGKLTVASQMIEKRSEELKAYFRAIIRAFWFMRDVNHFEYLRDLEARLRKTSTHNEDERGAVVTSPDRVESWALPIDGAVTAASVERIVSEMVRKGSLPRSIPVAEVCTMTPSSGPSARRAPARNSSLPLRSHSPPRKSTDFKRAMLPYRRITDRLATRLTALAIIIFGCFSAHSVSALEQVKTFESSAQKMPHRFGPLG